MTNSGSVIAITREGLADYQFKNKRISVRQKS